MSTDLTPIPDLGQVGVQADNFPAAHSRCTPTEDTSRRWRKRYALGVLTAVYTLNYVDRGLIGLLLDPIKADLHLSDTQLGFLTGIAFALFYAILGLPIARWADRGHRVTIASLAIGLWGLTVMASVFVASFLQLLISRVAAAIGESGCMPPTYSLLGDYFPKPAERTRAMTVYMLAGPLSVLVSFIAGGWLNDRIGWRLTFFVVGIPGLLMACLVRATIAEPPRSSVVAEQQSPRFAQVLTLLWRQNSARHLILGLILFELLTDGLMPWYASFMMRSHGMRTTELGLWLGTIAGFSGIVGICLGGFVANRWFAHNETGQLRLSAMMIALVVPFFGFFLLLPDKHQALVSFIPLVIVFNCFFGPAYALLQRLVPDRMRATTLAVMLLLANLIGMGIGPQVVGTLSDLLRPSLGEDSLRYSMLAMSCVALVSALHFWLAGRRVKTDLESVA